MAKPKAKKCKNPECGERFVPFNSLQKTCWKVECALAVGQKELQRKKKQAEKEYRAETKKRKEKLKSRTDWLREAQAVFNRWVRLRDEQKPCISCLAPPSGNKNGGSTRDAGHYRTVKAAPHLRFDEDNCHAQCVHCNQHKSGNLIEYRVNLVNRIGQERVDRLETTNFVKCYTIDEAKAIKAKYTKKIKEIEGR